MTAFIAAHPTIILRHFRSLPPSLLTDVPFTYLDLRPERIDHESGLRHRTMNPSIVAIFDLGDNGETTDLMDAAVDLLVDHFTSYPHIVVGTVWDAMTVADEAVPNDTSMIAVRFTFGNISIGEGRT
jgi:hypothetical protein